MQKLLDNLREPFVPLDWKNSLLLLPLLPAGCSKLLNSPTCKSKVINK